MSDKPEFKVGDKVARLRRGQYDGSNLISKITPTGKIRTDDNRLYTDTGKFITSDIWAWGEIQPWNDEYEAIVQKHEIISGLGVNLASLTLPQLRRLKALLDEFAAEKEPPCSPSSSD